MNTEDIPLEPLDIKKIFDRKKILYHSSDIAQMRFLVKEFIDYVLGCERKR